MNKLEEAKAEVIKELRDTWLQQSEVSYRSGYLDALRHSEHVAIGFLFDTVGKASTDDVETVSKVCGIINAYRGEARELFWPTSKVD